MEQSLLLPPMELFWVLHLNKLNTLLEWLLLITFLGEQSELESNYQTVKELVLPYQQKQLSNQFTEQ